MKAHRKPIIIAVVMLTIWLIMSFIDSTLGDIVDAGMVLTALRTLAIIAIAVECLMFSVVMCHVESLKRQMNEQMEEIKNLHKSPKAD